MHCCRKRNSTWTPYVWCLIKRKVWSRIDICCFVCESLLSDPGILRMTACFQSAITWKPEIAPIVAKLFAIIRVIRMITIIKIRIYWYSRAVKHLTPVAAEYPFKRSLMIGVILMILVHFTHKTTRLVQAWSSIQHVAKNLTRTVMQSCTLCVILQNVSIISYLQYLQVYHGNEIFFFPSWILFVRNLTVLKLHFYTIILELFS